MKNFNGKFKILTISFFILLGFLGLAGSSLAAPVISSFSGSSSFLNEEIVTVTGSNFGTARTPTYYDYFDDYASNWSCNTNDGSCTNPPASTGIAWSKYIFGVAPPPPNSDGLMTQITGSPLFNINTTAPNYSTGRSFVEYPEYYDGSVGGLPNGSLKYDPSNVSELFYVYYVKYDATWPIPYQPVQDKNSLWWLASGHKITGSWVYRGSPLGITHYEMTTEGAANMECTTCYGTTGTSKEFAGFDKWIQIKIHLKLNTWTDGNPNTDGVVQVWQDDELIINDSTIILSDTADDQFNYFTIRSNWSGGTALLGFGAGEEYYVSYDDILINASSTDPCGGVFPCEAIVYLSNSPTWGTGSIDKLNGDSTYVRQKVGGTADTDLGFKSWTDTRYKFEIDRGSLNFSNPVYLYVTNWDGETNSSGFLLEEADTTPPAAPSGLSVQ